jgi:hypothetical protein
VVVEVVGEKEGRILYAVEKSSCAGIREWPTELTTKAYPSNTHAVSKFFLHAQPSRLIFLGLNVFQGRVEGGVERKM